MPAGFKRKPQWVIAAGAGAAGITGIALLIALVGGRSGSAPATHPQAGLPKEQPAIPGQQKPTQPDTPAAPAVRDLVRDGWSPKLSLTVNGAGRTEVFRGWPLLVHAGVFHPGAFYPDAPAKPITLAPRDGSWAGAMSIEVRDKRGEPQSWTLHQSTPPPGPLALGRQVIGELEWSLSPDETKRLPEGDYDVFAVLDAGTSDSPDGWKGKTRPVPVRVHVADEPISLKREQESEKYLLLASFDLLHKDSASAMRRLGDLLSKQADNLDALVMKAELLTSAGKSREALALYNKALTVHYKTPAGVKEPPVLLLRKRRDLLAAFFRSDPEKQ